MGNCFFPALLRFLATSSCYGCEAEGIGALRPSRSECTRSAIARAFHGAKSWKSTLNPPSSSGCIPACPANSGYSQKWSFDMFASREGEKCALGPAASPATEIPARRSAQRGFLYGWRCLPTTSRNEIHTRQPPPRPLAVCFRILPPNTRDRLLRPGELALVCVTGRPVTCSTRELLILRVRHFVPVDPKFEALCAVLAWVEYRTHEHLTSRSVF